MKAKSWFGMLVLVAAATSIANADPMGTAFTYHGRLADGGQPVNGTYDLRFAIYDAAGGGTALAGPVTNSPVSVSNGVFMALLDFGGSVFNGQTRWLEIGVRSNGVAVNFTPLAPRQQLTPTPYALYTPTAAAAAVANSTAPNSVTGASIQSGSVGTEKIVNGSVTAAKLDPSIGLWNKSGNKLFYNGEGIGIGTSNPDAGLDLFGVLKLGAAGGWYSDVFHNLYYGGSPATWRNTAQGPGTRLWIRGGANESSGFGVQLSLLGTGAPAGSEAGLLEAFHIDGDAKAYFVNDVSVNGDRGGLLLGSSPGYHSMVWHNLYWGGNPATWRNIQQGPGTTMALAGGANMPSSFSITMSSLPTSASANSPAQLHEAFRINANGNVGINTGNPAARLHVHAATGRQIVAGGDGYGWVDVSGSAGGRGLLGGNMYLDNDTSEFKYSQSHNEIGAIGFALNYPCWNSASVICSGTESSTTGTAFTPKVIATFFPDGFVEVGALRIIGGADLAEPFEVSTKDIPKGSLVVIDERNPGQLKLSQEPYDRKVAGVISGANGITPGITLKQEGTADGEHNVALTGRVYVQADASNGPIEPGDLLTTSAIPGHAMKVTDHARAQGAIFGKAMTALPEGRGMVLVLVSLQ